MCRRRTNKRSCCNPLVLSDVVMPKLSGPEVVRRIQRFRPGIKTLLMSALAGEALGRHNVDPSMSVLRKPFTKDSLGKKIRAVLDEA